MKGEHNPANDLTKMQKRNGTLKQLINTNHFDISALAEVERDEVPTHAEPTKNDNEDISQYQCPDVEYALKGWNRS